MIRSATIKNKVYKFVHKEDVSVITNLYGRPFDSTWLNIDPYGKILVKGSNGNGYAWDGCSPKWNILDITWGTPDGRLDFETEEPMTYYASMIHDALYQYKGDAGISRKEADIIFRLILKEAGFRLWWIYGVAVRLGGGIYGHWKTKTSMPSIRVTGCSWMQRSELVDQK
ncbi:MAG: DUF1353 domain-containing protein [Bacteroidales bacterium]|jgi:hypothetical protein|nr:DUF1353 domain-containing protein [Bacteroidales bacterium]